MPDFRTVTVRPMTGGFDSLSSADEVGFGNWRVVKNATTRSTRNRQRAGGWRRLFADSVPYNNFDIHDQLVDRLLFYDEYNSIAMGGGGIGGYNYPYFVPTYTTPSTSVFPPASGPFSPVYLGDFPSGVYDGCPIFYPSVGYPFVYADGRAVDLTFLAVHFAFDEASGSLVASDSIGGKLLTGHGMALGYTGILGGASAFYPGGFSTSAYAINDASDPVFVVGDIKFGITGWFNLDPTAVGGQSILDRWGAAGSRYFKLFMSSGNLDFFVSPDGTASTFAQVPGPIALGKWHFFAAWHDPIANTINIKLDGGVTHTVAHATGVLASNLSKFRIGFDSSVGIPFNGRIDDISFWKNGFPTEAELSSLYHGGAGLAAPFDLSAVANTGSPDYWVSSFLYASCAVVYPSVMVPGYPYGPETPFYEPVFSYPYVYCGTEPHLLTGCREAITMLNEIVTASGRKLIASTMSRVYELNQSAGSWRILAQGLGNSGYTGAQCGCNSVRGTSATLGGYLIYTNGFDAPSSYFLGDPNTGCGLNALLPITDLLALGITRAGGVVVWKGFVIFYDFTEDGERNGGSVLWGDLDSPDSFIESDTSFAGRATVAVGETILAAAPLGNWLILYTDKSIIRVTLVGGADVFNFETIYKGGNALKYKYSLVNGGDLHLYLGESDVYVLTQFDTKPVSIAWVTKASGMIFKGITEDDATYEPINAEACNLVTGGWSEETREAWLSWPTGSNTCPNVTLRFNFKFQAADFIDHGFTAFLTFRNDERPTIGQWLEDLGVCPRGSLVATGPKDGPVCTGLAVAVPNPPLYIRNATEDPNLPIDPRSLCTLLTGKTLADFCEDCAAVTTFIAASAGDFTLKQIEDQFYYREMLGGPYVPAIGYGSCDFEVYRHDPYDTTLQTGAENYRSDDEKVIKSIMVEAEPLPQSEPSLLTAEVGYAATPLCATWKTIRPLKFECFGDMTTAQRAAAKIRSDSTWYFPCWRRGRFLSARFRISGIGGGGTFSALSTLTKLWGQQDSP